MDESTLYRQMCRAAQVIQSQWTPQRYDRYYKDYERWKGYGVIINRKQLQDITIVVKRGSTFYSPKYIWLPTQSQLQGMLSYKVLPDTSKDTDDNALGTLINHSFDLKNKTWDDKAVEFDTMEQLWLVIVMKELFGKYWTGKGWT